MSESWTVPRNHGDLGRGAFVQIAASVYAMRALGCGLSGVGGRIDIGLQKSKKTRLLGSEVVDVTLHGAGRSNPRKPPRPPTPA